MPRADTQTKSSPSCSVSHTTATSAHRELPQELIDTVKNKAQAFDLVHHSPIPSFDPEPARTAH